MPRLIQYLKILAAVLALLAVAGCAHLTSLDPQTPSALYLPTAQGPVPALAPAFWVHNYPDAFNRIGSPRARLDKQGQEEIRIDDSRPAIYYEKRAFRTGNGFYVNHIFRVHFVATPASLVPFLIGTGRNMGLLVLVTADLQGRPLLVTTVGTCGCYAVTVPTNHLPRRMLPSGWSGKPLEIYGETLPAMLPWPRGGRLVVEIRPGEHRVMGLSISASKAPGRARGRLPRPARLEPMGGLYRLPLGEKTTSLFYRSGWLAGYVKGAWKPWETFILGIPSLDMTVGMDKAYGDPRNPFYTSLQPWFRNASDLNNFPAYLKFNGWRL